MSQSCSSTVFWSEPICCSTTTPLSHKVRDFVADFLTRFAIQAKDPDGKWTRKPLAYRESNNVHLLITRPPKICVNLVFKHIHAASSSSARTETVGLKSP